MTVSQKFTPGDHPPGVFTVALCLILDPARSTHQFFLFLMRTKSWEAGQWAEVSWLDVLRLLAFLSFGGWFNIPASWDIWGSELAALYSCAVSLSSLYSFSGLHQILMGWISLNLFHSCKHILISITLKRPLWRPVQPSAGCLLTLWSPMTWEHAQHLEPEDHFQRWWPPHYTTYCTCSLMMFVFSSSLSFFPELS